METLREKARDLLANGTVQVVIGYEAGTGGVPRPCFARMPEQAETLIWNDACVSNLAGYVTKAEVKRLGKMAVAARPTVLRALLQLQAERQLQDGDVVALVVGSDGAVTTLRDGQAVQAYIAEQPDPLSVADREQLARLANLSRSERWAFWQQELARCIKCYACRSACPLCYCGRCTMDCNRPQWVPVPSHALGNLEYHTVRAMHLAGRCVECGECGRACPVGIPVHLLSWHVEETVHRHFGQRAGMSATRDYALGSFRADDKDNLIR